MRIYITLLMLFLPFAAQAYDPFRDGPCPQIDPKYHDRDGVPICPCAVKDGEATWSLFRCAIKQATSFHGPTDDEKSNMSAMLESWQMGHASDIMKYATALNLQVCRVNQISKGYRDSFLVIYVKPGVTDYSGPFFMLRETKHSKVLVIAPHDDSDSTWIDSKLALSETQAMGAITPGHLRGRVRKPDAPKGYADFVHTPGGSDYDLGTFAVEKICALNASSLVFHIHGMRDQTKVLYRARNNEVLEKAFEATVVANTYVREFKPLNADFTIDPLVNTNWYIKVEFPSGIHRNDITAMTRMVLDFEKQAWAW